MDGSQVGCKGSGHAVREPVDVAVRLHDRVSVVVWVVLEVAVPVPEEVDVGEGVRVFVRV